MKLNTNVGCNKDEFAYYIDISNLKVPEEPTNNKISNVANTFRGTTNLTSNIPLCNSKGIFTGIKNNSNYYIGYAYNTNVSNKTSFSGKWTEGTGSVTTSLVTHVKKTVLDTYSGTDAQLKDIGL